MSEPSMETWKLSELDPKIISKALRGSIEEPGEDLERALGKDDRIPVPAADYQPGGQFRSVVKVEMWYKARYVIRNERQSHKGHNKKVILDKNESGREHVGRGRSHEAELKHEKVFNPEEKEKDGEEDHDDKLSSPLQAGGPSATASLNEKSTRSYVSKSEIKSEIKSDYVVFQGSGYLIQKNLLVTAAHCITDFKGLGNVVAVKAYIGYHGKDSKTEKVLMDGGVEERWSDAAAVPTTWLNSRGGNILFDVGFVRLAKAFDRVEPVAYASTPDYTPRVLLVVGYPCDKEDGQRMYRGSGTYKRNLSDTPDPGKVKHSVSTCSGSSGSPVLEPDGTTYRAIATHTGTGRGPFNVATSIGRKDELEFSHYEQLFKTQQFTARRQRRRLDGIIIDSSR